MDARELRIGNYLQDREGRLCVVDFIDLNTNDIWAQGFRSPAIKGPVTSLPNFPILLTEEWLVKLGGINGDNNLYNSEFYCFDFNNISIFVSSRGWIELAINKYSEQSVKLPLQYLYVHNFMNLVFLLTGQELTLANEGRRDV